MCGLVMRLKDFGEAIQPKGGGEYSSRVGDKTNNDISSDARGLRSLTKSLSRSIQKSLCGL